MQKHKNIYLGDSYMERKGGEKEVARLIDGALDGKIKMVLSKKPSPSPKTSVKLMKKNLKIFLK